MLSFRDFGYFNWSLASVFQLNFFIPLDLNLSLGEWRSTAACESLTTVLKGQLEFN